MIQTPTATPRTGGSRAHLDAMLALCETVDCRRVRLLAYFGQESAPCGNCDTCMTPPESWDGTVPAQKLLSAVLRLRRTPPEVRRRARHRHPARQADPKVNQFGHDELTVFGIGTDLSAASGAASSGSSWPRAARRRGRLRHAGAHRASAEVLRRDAGPLRREPAHRAATRARRPRGRRPAPDCRPGRAAVRAAARLARRHRQGAGRPAYVVFHDATLRQIATRRRGPWRLGGISGMGAGKLERWGPALLEIVAA